MYHLCHFIRSGLSVARRSYVPQSTSATRFAYLKTPRFRANVRPIIRRTSGSWTRAELDPCPFGPIAAQLWGVFSFFCFPKRRTTRHWPFRNRLAIRCQQRARDNIARSTAGHRESTHGYPSRAIADQSIALEQMTKITACRRDLRRHARYAAFTLCRIPALLNATLESHQSSFLIRYSKKTYT